MKIDDNFFSAMGINMNKSEAAAFKKHFEQTLEERIGLALFDLLDDKEANELIRLQDSADDATINAWIKKHITDYEQVVQDEFDILAGEIADTTALIAA
jgi:hypothetical protein